MSAAEEDRKRAARAEQVALFRYQLIREAADPALSVRQRGRLVRELAARAHHGPVRRAGGRVAGHDRPVDPGLASRRVRRAGPAGPAGQPAHRRGSAGAGRRAETGEARPHRRAGDADLAGACGWSPSVRTLQRHFERLELITRPDGRAAAAFGRFEATRPNELWTGDALHGPHIAGRKAYLFAFLDDHSRAVMAARWGYFEDTVRLAAALRPALAARGVPDAIYVDNGSAFVDAALKRAAARLGIKITHSAPGRPQGRGKIERFFGVVRRGVPGRDRRRRRPSRTWPQLNKLFTAWHETVYHTRPHGETGQPPIDRWLAGGPFPAPRRPSCGRRSCGPSTGWSARTPRSSCSAAPTRPTRCWPAAASSASSTRSTWPSSRSAGTASPTGLARPQQIRPSHPSQGETGDPRRPAAGDRDRLPGHHRRRARGGRPPAPHPLRRRSPRAAPPRARPAGRAGGRAVSAHAGAARRAQRPDRLGRPAIPRRGGQRQPRRDRRLPGRQGRPAGAHRRRARPPAASPAATSPPPAKQRPGPVPPRTRPPRVAADITHPGGLT